MLVALDVGNTQTVVGMYDGEELREHWRTTTVRTHTGDELALMLAGLLELREHTLGSIDALVVASSVPQLAVEYATMSRERLGHDALIVGPGVRTGVALRVDNPLEVGPDRVANCVAAYALYGGPCIVVDFGTAINFDTVSAGGDFLGGAIAPGLQVALDALGDRAARLQKVELVAPARAIGTNTDTNVQSGAVFGWAGLVDGLVRRFRAELGAEATTIATGGLAALVAPHCETIQHVEPWLTLEGLRLIWERNSG